MSESNLPIQRKNTSPIGSQLRVNRALMAGGMLSIAGATGVFILTEYLILSFLLGFAALAFLGVRQLVNKSLAITAEGSQNQLVSTQHRLEQIKKEVGKSKFLEGLETEGMQVGNQAERLLQQYKSLHKLLGQKFETSEMTYSRYLGSIDSTCLSIGENLLHAKNLLEQLSLNSKSRNGQVQSQVTDLLTFIDEALLELANLFTSINEITTKEKHRDQLQQSMLQIKELAERAKIYSKH